MGIAIGLIGVGLTVLGIVLGYIWKSNGRLQSLMMCSLERIEEGQKSIMQMLGEGQKSIMQMLGEGQKSIMQMLEEGQRTIAQMLLNQTQILEKIDKRIG